MIGRLLVIAATAIGGGLLVGRRKLTKEVEKKLPAEIEKACTRAIATLDQRADQVIGEHLLAFVISIVVKAALIGCVYWFYHAGLLNRDGMRILGAVLITAFIIRDGIRVGPFIKPVFKMLRAANWRVLIAVREFIAGRAFDEAYAQAIEETTGQKHGRLLQFTRYSPEQISTEIASAVAEVTRSVTIDLVKVRILIAGFTALAMLGAYWMFFSLTIGTTTIG